MSRSEEMVKVAYDAMNEKLANDISIISIAEVSTIADYFMITNGKNPSQVQAIVENVREKMGRAGYETRNVEGLSTCSWVLLDYNEVVIHIFNGEDRRFYDLERVWRDGRNLEIEDIEKEI